MDSQTIVPTSEHLENRYKIKTKNLSFKLSSRYENQLNCFCWQEATNKSRYILKNVNCEAHPGEITAIAGPSGAGKTTLLDILGGMVVHYRFSGHVLVNDQPMKAAHFRKISGCITQDEALFPLLTVEETLAYSARLRLPGGREKAMARVQILLKELGLDHVAGVRVGSESNKRISGGEKRRVSIGVDLVHDPAVLLLDEPTSGLDSASALHVMSLLKSMAKNQAKTILVTIHQPSFRILELIDRVVLLSNGFVIHNGPLYLLEERLKSAGHLIPLHVNVLEFAIDVTESLKMEDSDIEQCGVEQEHDHFKRNSLVNVNDTRVFYSNAPIKEVLILSQRFSSNIFRTKQLFVARTIQALLAGILLGTIFMNANDENSKNLKLQNQLGFFAFSLGFLLSSTTEALPIFLQERRILMRETSRGAYRISSYIIANTLVFIPFLLVVAMLYTTPVYWLAGLRRETEGFLYFSLVVWMVILMSNSFVTCFSALVPNFIMGMSVVAGLMGSFFLFSGYFIAKDDIPKCWIFMHYLSVFKYPFECFMINEFGGKGGKWRCLQNAQGECLLYGDQFLMQQGLKESQKWSNLVVMLVFIFGYRFLCFVILCWRSYRNTS